MRIYLYCFLMIWAVLHSAHGAEAAKRVTSYIVVDADSGAILKSHHSQRQLHPASLTKMMTLYLTFDALNRKRLRLDQKLVVSRHAASMPPSELGLKKGDRISVRDAIFGAAIKSANDAAVVLAEAVGGSEKGFARMMTRKAKELGMRRTVFHNASGLTRAGHISTAEDMAILSRQLWRDHRDRFPLFAMRSIKIRGRTYRNTNALLGVAKDVDGLKTGYTRKAGYCFASTAERGERRIFVVVLGEASKNHRDKKIMALLNEGFKRAQSNRHRHSRFLPKPPKATEAGALIAVAPSPIRRQSPPKTSNARGASGTPKIPKIIKRIQIPARNGRHAPIAETKINGWAVQVGAFSTRRDATRQLQTVLRMRAPELVQAFRIVSRTETDAGDAIHRARFTGLNENTARKACDKLKKLGSACALVPPNGWESLQGHHHLEDSRRPRPSVSKR